jgi:glycosyltransferase involved in cell wall biosynthesis
MFSILLVAPISKTNKGGILSWANDYIDYAIRHKINVTVVDSSIIGRREKNIIKINLFDECYRFLRMLYKLKKSLRSLKIELIHFTSSCNLRGLIRDLILILSIKSKKIPIYFHLHCNIEDQIKNKYLRKNLYKLLSRYITKFIVLNSSSCIYLDKCDVKKVVIVPNGIDSSLIVKRKAVAQNLKNVIFVGRFEKNKGIIDYLKLAQLNPSINFHIVGSIPININRYPLGKNTYIHGSIEKNILISKLDESDLFVLPSRTEGFSIAILEAMARGLPILTTNVGAAIDVFGESNIAIVPSFNFYELSTAFNKFMEFDVRSAASNFNQKRINSFTTKKTLKLIFDTYEKK